MAMGQLVFSENMMVIHKSQKGTKVPVPVLFSPKEPKGNEDLPS